jgi:hypothetical protein
MVPTFCSSDLKCIYNLCDMEHARVSCLCQTHLARAVGDIQSVSEQGIIISILVYCVFYVALVALSTPLPTVHGPLWVDCYLSYLCMCACVRVCVCICVSTRVNDV